MKTNIRFIKYRLGGMIFSLIIISAGLVSYFYQGFNYSIDFIGGYRIQVKFNESINIEDLRALIGATGYEFSVQQIGKSEENQYSLKAKRVIDETGLIKKRAGESVTESLALTTAGLASSNAFLATL